LPLIALVILISLIPVYVEWRRQKGRATGGAGGGGGDEPGPATASPVDDRT
jgi:hypothetical protein